jgi:prevent-host-death family protein
MASVGVRQLRQRASELLRRVAQGETIEVTDRGRRVAVLSPLPEGNPLDRLRALGDVEPAKGDLDDLPEPLVLAPAIERPSDALSRLRTHER